MGKDRATAKEFSPIMKKNALDIYKEKGFVAMYEYALKILRSHVLTKTHLIDTLYDFEMAENATRNKYKEE